jgi:hypothetical protein
MWSMSPYPFGMPQYPVWGVPQTSVFDRLAPPVQDRFGAPQSDHQAQAQQDCRTTQPQRSTNPTWGLLGRRRRCYPSLQALVNLAAPTEAKRPAVSTLRPLHCKTKAYDEVAPVLRPHPTWRPTWNSTHYNRPRTEKCVTGPICNGFSVMIVCNPTL